MSKRKQYRVVPGYSIRVEEEDRPAAVYGGGEVFEAGPIKVGEKVNHLGDVIPQYKTVADLYPNRVEVDTGRTKKGKDGQPEIVWARCIDKEAEKRRQAAKGQHEARAKAILERELKQHQDRQERHEAIQAQGAKHRMIETPTGK